MYRKNYKKKKYALGFNTNPTEHNINPKDRKFSAKKYKNFRLQKLKKKNKSTFYFNIGGNMSKYEDLRLDTFKDILFSTKNFPSIQSEVKKKKFHPKVNKIYKCTPSKNLLCLFSRKKTRSIYDYTDLVHSFDFSSNNERDKFTFNYTFDNVYVTHTDNGIKLYFCSLMGKIIFAESYDLLVKKICFRFFTEIEKDIKQIKEAIIEYRTNYNLEDVHVWRLSIFNRNLYDYFISNHNVDMQLPENYNSLKTSPFDTILVEELHTLKTSDLDLEDHTIRTNLLSFITKLKALILEYKCLESKDTFFCKQEIVYLVSNGFNPKDKFHISAIFKYIERWNLFDSFNQITGVSKASLPDFNSYLFMSDNGQYDQRFILLFKHWCKNVLMDSNYYTLKEKIGLFSSIPIEFKYFELSDNRNYYSIYREFMRLVKYVENSHQELKNFVTLKKLVYTCKTIQCLLEKYPYLLSSAIEDKHKNS